LVTAVTSERATTAVEKAAARKRLLTALPGLGSRDPALHFIERTFGQIRRRVKVIGRLPGENSCLSLVWAVLEPGRTERPGRQAGCLRRRRRAPASRGWRGFTMTADGLRQLHDLGRQLLDPPTELP